MKNVLLAIVAMVVGLFLVVYMLVPTTEDALTEDYSEPFSVSTGAGVTSTNQTLSYEHWFQDLTDLTATSDNEDDTPVVLSYDDDTFAVEVTGLNPSDTRVLTINYVRTANQEFTGVSGFYRLMPFLIVVGLFVGGLWAMFTAIKGSRRG